MVSIELGETEDIAKQHLPDFEGNLSKLLRHSLLFYHQHTKTQKRVDNRLYFYQILVFLILGMGMLTFALSTYITILFLLIPFVLGTAGIFLIIFSVIIAKNKYKPINRSV